jgi:uncharacterized membrane protein YesL
MTFLGDGTEIFRSKGGEVTEEWYILKDHELIIIVVVVVVVVIIIFVVIIIIIIIITIIIISVNYSWGVRRKVHISVMAEVRSAHKILFGIA